MDSERDIRRNGRRGGHGRGEGYSVLVREPGTHLLFIGSYSCTRHKGTEKLQLQRSGKLTFLCLQDIDWITGSYLQEIEDAAEAVMARYRPQKLILFAGCQIELLSTDVKMLADTLSDRLGIPVVFHKGCHLTGYGGDLAQQEGL